LFASIHRKNSVFASSKVGSFRFGAGPMPAALEDRAALHGRQLLRHAARDVPAEPNDMPLPLMLEIEHPRLAAKEDSVTASRHQRLPSSHLPRHDVPSAALVRLPSTYRMRRSWSSAGPRSSRNAAAKTSLGMPAPRSSAVNVASGFRV
jgi:hypothetical protein